MGAPNKNESIEREKICNWLDDISKDAKEIYLLGDLFDFWFEYKKVIPKGFERLKGKLAHLTDDGIKINLFIGNHDLWTFGYLENELGLNIYKKPEIIKINNLIFYLAHGDGLGNGNYLFKFISQFIKIQYVNFYLKYSFSIGISFAQKLSKRSKKTKL